MEARQEMSILIRVWHEGGKERHTFKMWAFMMEREGMKNNPQLRV